MNGQSLDILAERLKELQELMPDVFSEGKIDFDRFRQALSPDAFAPPENYELTWAGKADARREIQRQTTATLAPDRDRSIDFDTTQNVFIEGENLDVLRTLQRAYFGKVKMIYIDPPYNTGNDSFVYPDDYAERLADYLQRAGQTNDQGYLNKQDLWRANRRENGQFHSAWMSMIYPRLFLARNMLSEDGVIFISIDDNEMSNLKGMMNEIFGEENFVACVCWQKKYAPANDTVDFSPTHDFILVYAKSRQTNDSGKILATLSRFQRTETQNRAYRNPDNDERGVWKTGDYTCNKSADQRPNLYYPIMHPVTQEEIWPNRTAVWRYSQTKHEQNVKENRVWWGLKNDNQVPAYKRFLAEVPDIVAQTWWPYEEAGHNDEAKKEFQNLFPESPSAFDTPKPTRLISRILRLCTSADDEAIIVDFFAGSATTAQAVLELNAEDGGNRRFVLVQLPEPTDPKTEASKAGYDTIAQIGRERIRRVIARMNEKIITAQDVLQTLTANIVKTEVAIADFRAKTPEIFNDANPPKPLKSLQDDVDKLRQKHTATAEKLTRLQSTDKGFRAFRLAPSNFKVWQTDLTDKTDVAQLLIDYERSDTEHAESERMLYEFLLKKGYPLTARIDVLHLDGIRAYSVEGGQMLVLLDGYNQAINDRIIETQPRHVVCLDRLFAGNDEALTNLHLDLRDRDIELSVI